MVGVIIRIKGQCGNSQEFFSRSWKKLNLENFRQKLKNSQWEEFYDISNLDEANSWLVERLRNVLQEECPIKVSQPIKKLKSWITPETTEVFRERDSARANARTSGDIADWERYKVLRNKSTKLMRQDKKCHFKNLYEKMEGQNNISGLYKSVRLQLGLKSGGPPQQLVVEGKILTAPKDIANEQLKYFKNKIIKLMASIPRPTEDPFKTLRLALEKWGDKAGERPVFSLQNVCAGETLAAINKLGNSSALSHDYIDSRAIKAAKDILTAPITYLANLSIQESKFARGWKCAKIIPIHKGKGTSRTLPKSYRPIAILPTISKIIEKLIHKQILSFMETSEQFSQNIHGYRNSHSTATALTQLSDTILQATDANLIATLVTVDESAAFDCVNFKTLDTKLEMYNFDEKTRLWIQNYLKERTQYVEIGVKQSEKMEIQQGVPQGSILGPLVYAIYTNELPEVVKSEECQDPSHKNQTKLFGLNCKKCGSVPVYADDATYAVETKTRQESQKKNMYLPQKR